MCLGSSAPALPQTPPPPQAAKAPDASPLKRRNATAAGGLAVPAGSTLLTGPSGIAANQLVTGTTSLLGGGLKP
jgi:hypothetical protein